jgi:predicted membrane-bound mannosyltransferase
MSILDLPRSPGQTRPAATAGTATTRSFVLSLEQVAYLVIGLCALLAHLWGLGDRALHHDETLHAAYSWNLYTGRGYMHDPLLHGPLLYHIGAFIYFLFGDNDFTARLGAALFGTALTLTPYLIRRELGRVAALVAALYLLISPTFLYVGRFIRHDMYSIVFEMLVLVAILRYASTRQSRWLYLGAAAFGLMVVNQETSYLFLVIMAAPLAVAILWRLFRPGIGLVGLLGIAVAALVFVLPGEAVVDGGHTATRDPVTNAMVVSKPGPLFGWGPLETYDNGYALRIRNRADNDGGRSLVENFGLYMRDLGAFFAHPAVLLAVGIGLATLGLLVAMIWLRRDGDGLSAWARAREAGDEPAQIITSLGSDRRLLIALAIFFSIYALFFTAFFTNMLGLITGTTGSVLYWLAQHNVERGGQPAHYYLLQLVVYEPLLIIWSIIGFVLIAWNGIAQLRKQSTVPGYQFSILLIAWWAIAAFGLYTWAGEKMPWLTVHIALPLVLLSAWAFQRAVVSGAAQLSPAPEFNDSKLAVPVYSGLFAAVAGLGFVLVTAYVGYGKPAVVPLWAIPIAVLVLLGLLTAGAGIRWGWRWAVAMLAICGSLLLGVYTTRAAYRLSYLSGDVPRELLIYTQTSPDVMRVVRRVEEASRKRGGGLDLPILYDNETVWSWYLRDFTNGNRTNQQLSGIPGPEIQAVFMLQENLDQYPQNRQFLSEFVIQRLPLRWWLPEEQTYRLGEGWTSAPPDSLSLLGRFLRDPLAYENQVNVWNYLMFRRTTAALGSTDFVIAVRPALADQIGPGLGGDLAADN